MRLPSKEKIHYTHFLLAVPQSLLAEIVQLLTLCWIWIRCVEIAWQICWNALTSYFIMQLYVMNISQADASEHALSLTSCLSCNERCSETTQQKTVQCHSLAIDHCLRGDSDGCSATYCLLAMESWDWLAQKMHHHSQSVGHVKIWREIAAQFHIHPIGHMTRLDCLPESTQCHSHPVGHGITWHATPWLK